MIDPSLKFVAIVGPTATGKTELALALAEEFRGEIICADSRTMIRGLDIGTAKPTMLERSIVPHHMLDIIEPGERMSAPVFKDLAERLIIQTAHRGNLPFLVGGSGLYIDSVIYDYQFPPAANIDLRNRLELMTNDELEELLVAQDPVAYERLDTANRRRVIRAIETAGQIPLRRADVLPQVLVLGNSMNKDIIQKRVVDRVEKMLKQGFIDEVRTIGEKYGWENDTFSIIGYGPLSEYIFGRKTLSEANEEIVAGTMGLVKKQVTWFKRNSSIQWVDSNEEARALIEKFLEDGN